MDLEEQRKLLKFLEIAKDFIYQFEILVPLYLGATAPHSSGVAQRAAVSMMEQAERAKQFREELETLILKAKSS